MSEQMCQKQVREPSRWINFYQCSRKATVSRDGKHYCRQHDPERVAEEERKRWEYRNAEWEAKGKRRRLEHDAGILDLTNEELQAIVDQGGVREMLKRAKETTT